MAMNSPIVSPDLQSLAQQASEASDLPRNDAAPSIIVPISNSYGSSSQELPINQDAMISDEMGGTNPLSEVADHNATERKPYLYSDLIDQGIHDGYTASLPQSQYSDATYGVSHQMPEDSVAGSEGPQIRAFAKLVFDDGEFFMTTYAVELGRDVRAARLESERSVEGRGGSVPSSTKRSASGDGSIRSEIFKRENACSAPGSVVSEHDGVTVNDRRSQSAKKTRRKKLKSKNSIHSATEKINYNALAMASLMENSAERHPAEINGISIDTPPPSFEVVPLIPIHPAGKSPGDFPGHKSISRKHVKIAFNFTENLFQVEIMGRNGVFVDEEWHPRGHAIPLVNGSVIQIGGVKITFVLPDVPVGETGADMSLDIGNDVLDSETMSADIAENGEEESDVDEEEEEEEETNDTAQINPEDDEREGEEEEEEEEGRQPESLRTRGTGKKQTEISPSNPAKRKGPGRPPKNGIISKKKQALLAKQAKEEAKVKVEGRSVPVKGKNAKDIKETKQTKELKQIKETKQGEDSVQPNGKRKYVKRKRAGGTEDPQAVRESTELTESVLPEEASLLPKPAKEKKPVKPPRSPSPVFDESKMTPEQLAKPQASYVVLIHEALSNSPTGQMSLPQIYRAIERRYPYYKLRVTTQGWQSSVRHNLSQHAAFTKIERDGKGWMWGLVPEVSIEKEKKRRMTPPPVSQQHYYPQNAVPQHPYPYPGMLPPNGHIPQRPYGMHPGMQPGRMPYPPPPRPGFPPPLMNAQSESTYRSPYQSTPPPAAPQVTPQNQQPPQTNGTNGHYPTPVSQPPPSQLSGNHHHFSNSGPNTSPSPHPPQPSALSRPFAAASEAASNVNPQQDVNSAMSKFKAALINNMDDKVRGEAIVTSAINRVLGIHGKSSLPSTDISDEETIMKAFTVMLGNLSKQNLEAKKHPLHHPSSTAVEPEVRALDLETPTSIATAAENAAKIALANGDPHTAVPRGESTESNRGSKRPSDSHEDRHGSVDEREAKRIAP